MRTPFSRLVFFGRLWPRAERPTFVALMISLWELFRNNNNQNPVTTQTLVVSSLKTRREFVAGCVVQVWVKSSPLFQETKTTTKPFCAKNQLFTEWMYRFSCDNPVKSKIMRSESQSFAPGNYFCKDSPFRSVCKPFSRKLHSLFSPFCVRFLPPIITILLLPSFW